MKNSRITLCLWSGLILGCNSLFLACNKADLAVPAPSLSAKTSSNSVLPPNYVSDGINVYSSRKDFTNTFSILSAYNDYDLMIWDNDNGLYSLEEYADAIDNDVAALDNSWTERYPYEEQSSDELKATGELYDMPDRVFACMLNKNACIQVGDTLYRFDSQTTYLYHPSRRSAVAAGDYSNYFSTAPANIPLMNSGSLTTANTSNKSKNDKPKDEPVDGPITIAGACDPAWNQAWTEIYGQNGVLLPRTSNNRNTRLKCVLYNVNTILFSSTGVRSRYERKTRFTGWVKEQCSSISVDGLIYFNNGGSGRHTSTATNKSYTDGSISWKPFNWNDVSRYSFEGRATYKGVTVSILRACQ